MNLIRRNIKKVNFPKRNLYTSHDYTDLNDYSLVPAAYVVTISSILWGFESHNEKQNIEDNHHYLLDEIYIECVQHNDRNYCNSLKQNLYFKLDSYNLKKLEKKTYYFK